MGVSPYVAVLAVIVFFVAVAVIWWLRYNEKKTVVRNVARRPQPYLGRMANHVYQIPLSRNFVYQTPPPTFSKAVKLPVPKNRKSVVNINFDEEAPPPSYEQYVKAQEAQQQTNQAYLSQNQINTLKAQEKQDTSANQTFYCEFI